MQDGTYLASIYRLEAVNYWESAKTLSASFETKLEEAPGNISAIPFYHLISHAAELLLKSALLKRGFTESDLKKFTHRHSLKNLMEELQTKGVDVTPNTIQVIIGLDKQHQKHALRYTALVDDGEKTYMPPPKLVFEVLGELLMLTRISTQGV